MTLFQACGSSQTNENKPVSLTGETTSEFPFSTKEPEVYQGYLVVTSGKTEDKWFVALKGNNWKIDFYDSNGPSRTHLKTDRMYGIDHRKKIYAAFPENEYPSNYPTFFSDATYGFFRGKEYREFEIVGREGNLIKYKVRSDMATKGDVFIFIDEASGLMVRQEFTSLGEENGIPVSYIYEIRNLQLEVEDGVLAIPNGYREVGWNEFGYLRQNK